MPRVLRVRAARLTDQGLFVQWIPLGTLHSDFKTTLRTLTAVFEHVEVFYFPPEAVIFVASREPLAGRPPLAPARYESLPVGRDLAEHFMPSPAALWAHRVAGKEQLARVLGEGPLSTWDRLVLDFAPFKATPEEWAGAVGDNLGLLLEAEHTRGDEAIAAGAGAEQAYGPSTRLLRLACLASYRGDQGRAIELAQQALAANPDDGEVKIFLTRLRAGLDPRRSR